MNVSDAGTKYNQTQMQQMHQRKTKNKQRIGRLKRKKNKGQQNKDQSFMNMMNQQENKKQKQQERQSGIDLSLPYPHSHNKDEYAKENVGNREAQNKKSKDKSGIDSMLPKPQDLPNNSFYVLADYKVVGGKVDRNKELHTNLQEGVTRGRDQSHVLHGNLMADPRLDCTAPATTHQCNQHEQTQDNVTAKNNVSEGNLDVIATESEKLINNQHNRNHEISGKVQKIGSTHENDNVIDLTATTENTSQHPQKNHQVNVQIEDGIADNTQPPNKGAMAEDMGSVASTSAQGSTDKKEK